MVDKSLIKPSIIHYLGFTLFVYVEKHSLHYGLMLPKLEKHNSHNGLMRRMLEFE